MVVNLCVRCQDTDHDGQHQRVTPVSSCDAHTGRSLTSTQTQSHQREEMRASSHDTICTC